MLKANWLTIDYQTVYTYSKSTRKDEYETEIAQEHPNQTSLVKKKILVQK